jgi:type II secretory pathway component PulL
VGLKADLQDCPEAPAKAWKSAREQQALAAQAQELAGQQGPPLQAQMPRFRTQAQQILKPAYSQGRIA